MAEVLIEEGSVLGQDCVAADTSAGKLRIERCYAAEGQLLAELRCELEENHAEKQTLAAALHIVVMDTGAVHFGTGSQCGLAESAETAAAGTGTLAGLVEIVDMVVLPVGLGEFADIAVSIGLAVVADNDMLGTVGYADTVAQDSLVVVADTDTAVLDIVGSADTAGVVGTVGLVHIVGVVDNAEVAAGTADTVAATGWQPYSTVVPPDSCFCRLEKKEKENLPWTMKISLEIKMFRAFLVEVY